MDISTRSIFESYKDLSICFATLKDRKFYRIDDILVVKSFGSYALILLSDDQLDIVERSYAHIAERIIRYGFVEQKKGCLVHPFKISLNTIDIERKLHSYIQEMFDQHPHNPMRPTIENLLDL